MVPHGRASFHGGAAAQPQASTSRAPAPGAGPSIREGATVGGRGASRFREQRESVIVTRPSADFDKLGKSKQTSTISCYFLSLVSYHKHIYVINTNRKNRPTCSTDFELLRTY